MKRLEQFCQSNGLILKPISYKGFTRKGYDIEDAKGRVIAVLEPRRYRPEGSYAKDKWFVVIERDYTKQETPYSNRAYSFHTSFISNEVMSQIARRAKIFSGEKL